MRTRAEVQGAVCATAETPLHDAARKGDTEVVWLLLLDEAGVDKDALDGKGRTPLSIAVKCGHLAVTKALLATGADMSLRYGSLKNSVAHLAVEAVAILRLLVKHEVDVNARAGDLYTPLHLAAESNKVESIRVLVKAGANIEARSNDGLTPLHKAVTGVNLDAVIALLRHGADVNAVDEDEIETPLFYSAAGAGREGTAEIVDVLLISGADEAIVNVDGDAPFDVIGTCVEEDQRAVKDFERVRELLMSTPADRAWRRRGHLVLYRARPDRLRLSRKDNLTRTGVASRSRAKMASAEMGGCSNGAVAGGACTVDATVCSDLAGVASRVVELEQEDAFRMIVGFL